MALFAIPNPKKSIQVDFPVEVVKQSVKNINLINDKYKFTSANEIFNQYTYEALEFLSLGVFIDINLNAVNENKTEIVVEVRRKLGSFNQSHEVTKANEHLVKIFDAIAKLTGKTTAEIETLRSFKSPPVRTVQSKNHETNSFMTTQAWYEKKWLVVLMCIIFFPVGLYALWKNSSIAKGWKIAVTVLLALIVIANLNDNKKAGAPENAELATTADATAPGGVVIGQVLKTDYFEITVNKAELSDQINTGNQFTDLKPEQGITYLVINTTFKNIDNESRMLIDGSVWINYNGKDYEFDKSETVMAEGWGLMLDQINPLTSKTTNLVYKIPSEIKGKAKWQPGRSDDDEVILLGTL
ncbi:hypothetical protein FNO01nite_33440 [Flavobacterium noncentrifugens]|uniref:DUF4352 domain-containing protein n=1 Tax=Flavobacterium noncentrifugens TaxID=1128970 RepID=A0A1G8Y687_9FLAO|nr:DUF4352 domain-containing protein [Flavobacterium noncentrifugens]GEP52672.1 hypothetical protein FNO01nite_33440 [Flavobacterium noncentrifugens]SDJ98147.1 protein of unknown function [Flavobacterium noncentrifugens]